MKQRLTPIRIFCYLAGMMILAIGIAASMRSDLGSSPVASVPYSANIILGLEMGTATIIWQSFLVLLQFLILRREFSPWTLLQLITGFIFGYFNSFAVWLLSFFPAPTTIVARLFCTFIGFAVGGFGVWLYSTADVINMPSEGIVMVIAGKVGQPFHRIKICFDIASVVLAGCACLIFVHGLGSVGVGTVIISIMLGTMVGVYERYLGKSLKSLLSKGKPIFK